MTGQPPKVFACSFCAKTQEEVSKLIAGADAFICDQCIGLCMTVMAQVSRQWFDKEVESARASKADARRASRPMVIEVQVWKGSQCVFSRAFSVWDKSEMPGNFQQAIAAFYEAIPDLSLLDPEVTIKLDAPLEKDTPLYASES